MNERTPVILIGLDAAEIDVIDRLVHELRHEVHAYQEFHRFRERERLRRGLTDQHLERRLHLKRKQLRGRIQGKQMRRAGRPRVAANPRLWRRNGDRNRAAEEIPLPSACAWALSQTS